MNQPLNWTLILNTPEYGWPADLVADAKAARDAEAFGALPTPAIQSAAAEARRLKYQLELYAPALAQDEAEIRRHNRVVRLFVGGIFIAGLMIGGSIAIALQV